MKFRFEGVVFRIHIIAALEERYNRSKLSVFVYVCVLTKWLKSLKS